MGWARASRRLWAVLGGRGGSAPSTGDLAARGVLQRSGGAALARSSRTARSSIRQGPQLPNPLNLMDAQRSQRALRGGRHSEPLCLGRRREFYEALGSAADEGFTKTIFDNDHYRKCDDCRPTRRAAMDDGRANWGDRWALNAAAVRGRRFPSARSNGTSLITGAPLQRACWSAAQRCAGAAFARGEPDGACGGVGRGKKEKTKPSLDLLRKLGYRYFALVFTMYIKQNPDFSPASEHQTLLTLSTGVGEAKSENLLK